LGLVIGHSDFKQLLNGPNKVPKTPSKNSLRPEIIKGIYVDNFWP
jgi:hypothetical protein